MESFIEESVNGQIIRGILHLPKSSEQKPPIIIMCHGYSGDRIGPYPYLFVLTARLLTSEGYAVIRFDFRGGGESDGLFEEQNLLTQCSDLAQILSYVKKHPDLDAKRVGIIGHSRGGAVAIMTAVKDKRVKSLVTWATPAHWNEIWQNSENEIQKKGFVEFSSLRETRDLYSSDIRHQPIDYAKKVVIPWLIIQGGKDGQTPGSVSPYHAKLLYKSNPTKRELKIILTADHIFFDKKDRKKLWQQTLGWFKKTL